VSWNSRRRRSLELPQRCFPHSVPYTVEESEEFLRCYEEARSQEWSNTESRMAWLSGLWVLAYNAKKETLGSTDSPYWVVAPGHVERLAGASIQ